MAVEARIARPNSVTEGERFAWWSRALAWVIAASTLLNVGGIWWGIPRDRGWAVDEIDPLKTLEGLAAWFSRGWHDVYPPLQHYLLAVVYSPILILDRFGFVDTGTPSGFGWLMLASRVLSVLMAAGTLAAVYSSGTLVAGRRTGLFAAVIVALTVPFVYYAKTANVDVPYLFWFAVSLVFYLRVLTHLQVRDFAWLAATATLAVCTKDQAYGLYVLIPIPIIVELWRFHVRVGSSRPIWRAIFDRRSAIALLLAAALFVVVHNLVFNLDGFAAHIRFLRELSRVTPPFDTTLAGRFALVGTTIDLVRRSLGWPLFIACVSGVLVQFVRPASRRQAMWLAVPAVSYLLTFINVVGFSYDRFVLPICLVLAIFGGVCLDRLTRPAGPLKRWRQVAVVGAFAYSFLNATTVDVLMATDSRYAAEEWLRDRVEPDQSVGTIGLSYILPRLDGLRRVALTSLDHLAEVHPDFVIVNTDYFRQLPDESPDSTADLIASAVIRGELGYNLVTRFPRSRTRWSWLPGMHPDLTGKRRDQFVLSNLFHISPTIEIYQRPYPEPSYDAWLQMPGRIRAWLFQAHGVPPSDGLIGHHLFRWREERVPADEVRRRIFLEAGKPVPVRP